MRGVLILVIVVMVAVFAGWLTFSKYGDRATITIDGEKFQKDTKETIDSAKQMIDKVRHNEPAPPAEVQPPPHLQPRTTSNPAPQEVVR